MRSKLASCMTDVFVVVVSVFKQKTAYEIRISDWSSDVCSSDLFESRLLQAKEAAEAASRAKSQFLANMSHELRTPLNAIIGFAEIMVRQMMGPLGEHYAEYAGDIHQSGRHLLDLINDILDISSVESGKATLGETSAVDLHEEVATCAHLLGHGAQATGVAISHEVPAAAPCLVAQPRRLRQIPLNLMTHSVKFSPPGPTVSARLDLADDVPRLPTTH